MTKAKSKSDRALRAVVAKLKINSITRHIFICTGPKCCSEAEGLASWKHLKQRLKDSGLTPGPVFRTKVGCLRICQEGPIALVYPEGTWYKDMNKTNLDRVIDEHLCKGQVVESLCFTRKALPASASDHSHSSSESE